MLRKLGSYPRQNGLAVALRELDRIERSLFILGWIQSVDLRRCGQVGLNKGEACNALASAVFFHQLGEIRDRGFEQQRYRASGLNLLTAAIVLWNAVYLQRAVQALRTHGQPVDEALLPYLSPLGWEHINLTGDYSWRTKRAPGKFQPTAPFQASTCYFFRFLRGPRAIKQPQFLFKSMSEGAGIKKKNDFGCKDSGGCSPSTKHKRNFGSNSYVPPPRLHLTIRLSIPYPCTW